MFSGYSCYAFFNESMRIESDKIDKLCARYDIKNLDDIEKLIFVCRYKYNDEWNVMDHIVDNPMAMEEFCDRTEEDGFSGAYEKAEIYLDTYY